MRVIVTRPRPDAERTAEALRAAGHEPILSPVLVIEPTGSPVPSGGFDAVIVTSAHALPPVTAQPPSALLGLPCHAVGAATGAAAREAGFRDVRVGAGSGEALARDLVAHVSRDTRLLYLAGRDRTPALEAALADAGLAATTIEVYSAEPAGHLSAQAQAALPGAAPLAVLHFSRRSTELFLDYLDKAAPWRATPGGLVHCCLSEAVAEPLARRGLSPLVATKPRADALMRLLPG